VSPAERVSNEVLAAFELERLLHRAAAERFERVPCGWVAANGSLPAVWDASRVQVEPDAPPPTLEELLELAELPARWFPQLRHRQAYIAATAAGTELAFSLARRGWHVNELWLMVRRTPPRRVPPQAARVDGAPLRNLKGRLGVEQGLDPAHVAEFDRYDDLRARAGARLSHAGVANGNAVALADLYLRGDIAVIEDVATLRRFRGRGYGSAAVLSATAAAFRVSARAVYLFAAPDVARGFYERLGFERIGGAYDCQLAPAGEHGQWRE
jgi:ribosomal protein S18 acetylase RimI-like enzyme